MNSFSKTEFQSYTTLMTLQYSHNVQLTNP